MTNTEMSEEKLELMNEVSFKARQIIRGDNLTQNTTSLNQQTSLVEGQSVLAGQRESQGYSNQQMMQADSDTRPIATDIIANYVGGVQNGEYTANIGQTRQGEFEIANRI